METQIYPSKHSRFKHREPYGVLAFQSDISPPGVAPLLLPWSETQAALIGGNSWNTQVMLLIRQLSLMGAPRGMD